MSRHQLTPEERARGHKLTKADRIKGGRNVPRAKRAAAALKYPAHIERLVAVGAKYRLTSERARELAKLSAQVRRERRAKALVTLALDREGRVFSTPEQNKRLTEIYLGGQERIELTMAEVGRMEASAPAARRGMEPPKHPALSWLQSGADGMLAIDKPHADTGPVMDLTGEAAYELGASLAGKLMAGEGASLATVPGQFTGIRSMASPPPPDAFTLSALKRFRLGPKSPLHLTRGQRAQVDLMVRDGWLEVTGDSMLQLTAKGWQAVENQEAGNV